MRQLKILGSITQSVVKLRRSDQNAARLQIETERWEIARPVFTAQNDARLKRLQRDALAVPILAPIKAGERLKPLGNTPVGKFYGRLLSEIESCPDPAHFKPENMSPETEDELVGYIMEAVTNPPKPRSPMQAAMEELREMDQAMEQLQEEKKARRAARLAAAEHQNLKPSQPTPPSQFHNLNLYLNPNLPPTPPSKETSAQPAATDSPPPAAAAPLQSGQPINPIQAKSSNSSEPPNPPSADPSLTEPETPPMSN